MARGSDLPERDREKKVEKISVSKRFSCTIHGKQGSATHDTRFGEEGRNTELEQHKERQDKRRQGVSETWMKISISVTSNTVFQRYGGGNTLLQVLPSLHVDVFLEDKVKQ